ncbi:MAG TPA: glycosyltransferase family 4 protein [Steroidobacteraceae bacterium]|nr:glycosyltransferase family 4 protein [Steroidobacteraceae bacterium]
MRPAKVVFVNRYFHPDESATSRLLSDLAFRLAAAGVPVSVITSRQLYENPRARLPAHEHIRGVEVHRIATARRGRSGLAGRALDYASFHVSAAYQLLRVLSPGDVVVAKTDPPLICIAAQQAARRRGASLVNWLQDIFPEVAGVLTPALIPAPLRRLVTGLRDRALRAAAVNVVLSEGMRARLQQRGVAAGRLRVVPNWTDTDAIRPLPSDQSTTRRRHGLDGRFVVGYSGNFGRAHEFDTLLGAARLLAGDGFTFLMTGGGARWQELRAAAATGGLDNLIFQGYQPAELLGDSLAAADVHLVSLLPALEGLIVPSKVYGILAAGRAVLFIGDTGGDTAQLIREHDCGIAVEVGDSQGMAAQLRALRAAPERLQRMGHNARELALARYTGAGAAEEWLRVLRGIAPAAAATTPPPA